MEKIICYACKKPVTSSKDLITVLRFFRIRPYHAACYAHRLKTLETIFLKNYPLNSIGSTISAIISSILALIFIVFFVSQKIWFGVLLALFFLLWPWLRLRSYLKFERFF